MTQAHAVSDEPADIPVQQTKGLADALVLAGDCRLAQLLRETGAGSAEYTAYEEALRHYALNILFGQLQKNELFATVARRTGIVLPRMSSDQLGNAQVRSIVAESVLAASSSFMISAIIHGGWDPSKRCSIKTFFVGRCYFAFADAYRAELKLEKRFLDNHVTKGAAADLDQLDAESLVRHSAIGVSPEASAVAADTIRHLLGSTDHPHIRDIFLLESYGWKGQELADRIGISPKAVSRAKAKFRSVLARLEGGRR